MKMKQKYILIYLPVWLAVVWLLPSCNEKLDLPAIDGKKSITLLGELVANDSFYLRAGQSVSLIADENLRFEVLNGLTLYVVDGQDNIPLTGKEDTATQSLHTIPFVSKQKVLPGRSYSVVASHSSLGVATASIDIPSPFTAAIIDTQSVSYSTEHTLKVTFRIDDPGNTTNFYVVEAIKQKAVIRQDSFLYQGQWLSIDKNSDLYYDLIGMGTIPEVKIDTVYSESYVRRVLYTDDAHTDNVLENGMYHRNRRVFLKDNTFNGTSYISHVYIPVDTFSTSIFEMGAVRLLIKSVPENYYKFLKAYQTSSDGGGYSTFSQPVKVVGNVNNGVGMVGGAYLLRLPILFDSSF
jgi:hypothetical protein